MTKQNILPMMHDVSTKKLHYTIFVATVETEAELEILSWFNFTNSGTFLHMSENLVWSAR
jgi:hypothetical protein